VATARARNASAAEAELSGEAKEIQRVADLVANEADVREDIVASLRERIANGTYNVTGEQIGEMMIRRFLADRVR
jgi:negative regulator of flagellin synthesis FlgM